MTDEEYIMYKLDTINRNSTYGLVDAERLDRLTMEACNDLARIWNVGPGEVEKMVRDYIGAVTCDFKPLQTYPKPHIHIRPVKVKTLKERLEETKMNSTSTETFKDIIAVDLELQTFPNPDTQDKFIVSATNRDDIFCFVFEGPHIADTCRKAGLFTGWEKDQKIRELEAICKDISDDNALLLETNKKLGKELGDWKKEAANCLALRDEQKEENMQLKQENKKLKQQLQQVERDKKRLTGRYEGLNSCYNGLLKDYHQLKDKLDRERAANEAQHKFFVNYAGKGTEIEFNYAIGDTDEVSYVIVDKERYQTLKDNGCNVTIHGKDYTPMQLVDRIFELERLKTPTIENFADEEPSSRRDILRCAEKCVCGKREQDYGTPESNFQLIADLWNGYLGGKTDNPVISVTSVDVSMMMALMKIARIRNGGGSGDSFVDLAGYAACGGEIWALKKETNGDSSQDTN